MMQLKGALVLATRSTQIMEQVMATKTVEDKELVRKQSFCINCLGRVHDRLGNEDEALKYYSQGLELRMKSEGPISLLVSNSINNIAVIHRKKNLYAKAIELYKKALDIVIQVTGEQHGEVADVLSNLGEVSLFICQV